MIYCRPSKRQKLDYTPLPDESVQEEFRKFDRSIKIIYVLALLISISMVVYRLLLAH